MAWSGVELEHVLSALGHLRPDHKTLRVVDGYPHIAYVRTEVRWLVLKKITGQRKRDAWFEVLYESVQHLDWAATPYRNKSGRFTTPVGDSSIAIVLDKLPAGPARPTAAWWARSLGQLHDVECAEEQSRESNYVNSRIASAFEALRAVDGLLPQGISDALTRGLLEVDSGLLVLNGKEVVVHADPNTGNVRGVPGRLFDFDRSGFAFREYDMQRLLWHLAAEDPEAVESLGGFWRVFKKCYEKQAGVEVDRTTLLFLYFIDIARAVSWLALVSADSSRPDRARQATLLAQLLSVVRHSVVEKTLRSVD
ncbi:MAG: phosphotransferase [Pseudonocardiaceae bacterium]